ncbi:hypothetical protein IE81DRAFT_366601 [Ceraceosorus guamensis]|uniref:Uncharacterized protein n=1 Tax=Ceraceosorus guamensis TaxID=1522189 RepID=A0A316VXV1_9BASI|nr:hypothetical protein IE81DRAFT_366601 [Ceraceosorus guamensis]PWN42487.1 hypothetical protein IE81DRAFT_366601 [Ceraceosorus guamensis]
MKLSTTLVYLAILASPTWTAPIEQDASSSRSTILAGRQPLTDINTGNLVLTPRAIEVARPGDVFQPPPGRVERVIKELGKYAWNKPYKSVAWVLGFLGPPLAAVGAFTHAHKMSEERKKYLREHQQPHGRSIEEDDGLILLSKRNVDAAGEQVALAKRAPPVQDGIQLGTLLHTAAQRESESHAATQEAVDAVALAKKKRRQDVLHHAKFASAVGALGGGLGLFYYGGVQLAHYGNKDLEPKHAP